MLLEYMESRFGIPAGLFDDYMLLRRRATWLLLRKGPAMNSATPLKVSKAGMKAFKKVGAFFKPTTRLIQVFGSRATRARLEIDEAQALRLIKGEEIRTDLGLNTGYVILSMKGDRILGLGFYIDGAVRSQIPRKEIRAAMLVQPVAENSR
jgi:NOL1/NOP2/fmu family ribosome biogenesis protein